MDARLIKNFITLSGLVFSLLLLAMALRAVQTYVTRANSGDFGPKNPPSVSVTTNSASLSWTSNKPSVNAVIGGTEPGATAVFAGGSETEETADHKLTLSFLKSGATYYYKIKVGGKTYPENGTAYSFTTQTNASPASEKLVCGNFEGFMSACSPEKQECDFNKDGSINSTDYLLCLQKEKE